MPRFFARAQHAVNHGFLSSSRHSDMLHLENTDLAHYHRLRDESPVKKPQKIYNCVEDIPPLEEDHIDLDIAMRYLVQLPDENHADERPFLGFGVDNCNVVNIVHPSRDDLLPGDQLLSVDGVVVFNGQESVLKLLNEKKRSFDEQIKRIVQIRARRRVQHDTPVSPSSPVAGSRAMASSPRIVPDQTSPPAPLMTTIFFSVSCICCLLGLSSGLLLALAFSMSRNHTASTHTVVREVVNTTLVHTREVHHTRIFHLRAPDSPPSPPMSPPPPPPPQPPPSHPPPSSPPPPSPHPPPPSPFLPPSPTPMLPSPTFALWGAITNGLRHPSSPSLPPVPSSPMPSLPAPSPSPLPPSPLLPPSLPLPSPPFPPRYPPPPSPSSPPSPQSPPPPPPDFPSPPASPPWRVAGLVWGQLWRQIAGWAVWAVLALLSLLAILCALAWLVRQLRIAWLNRFRHPPRLQVTRVEFMTAPPAPVEQSPPPSRPGPTKPEPSKPTVSPAASTSESHSSAKSKSTHVWYRPISFGPSMDLMPKASLGEVKMSKWEDDANDPRTLQPQYKAEVPAPSLLSRWLGITHVYPTLPSPESPPREVPPVPVESSPPSHPPAKSKSTHIWYRPISFGPSMDLMPEASLGEVKMSKWEDDANDPRTLQPQYKAETAGTAATDPEVAVPKESRPNKPKTSASSKHVAPKPAPSKATPAKPAQPKPPTPLVQHSRAPRTSVTPPKQKPPPSAVRAPGGAHAPAPPGPSSPEGSCALATQPTVPSSTSPVRPEKDRIVQRLKSERLKRRPPPPEWVPPQEPRKRSPASCSPAADAGRGHRRGGKVSTFERTVQRLMSARAYSSYLPGETDSMSIRDGMAERVGFQLEQAIDLSDDRHSAARVMQMAWRTSRRRTLGLRLDESGGVGVSAHKRGTTSPRGFDA